MDTPPIITPEEVERAVVELATAQSQLRIANMKITTLLIVLLAYIDQLENR